MTCASPATSATLLVVLALHSVSAQLATSRCSGTVDRCSGHQNLTGYGGKALSLRCPLSTNSSAVQWFVNGVNVNFTGSSIVLFYSNPYFFTIQKRNGSSSSITVYPWTPGEYNFSCAPDEFTSSTYTVCVLPQGRFLPLIPSTSLLATKTFYAKAGDVVEMNCTYNFQAPETTYTYSLTWTRNVTKDIQVTSTEVSNTISCHDLGGNTFSSRLLVIAGDEGAQYSCIIGKTDFENPSTSSVLVKQYLLISLQPRQIITYPAIAGVSASVFIVLVAIAYVVWRFLTPLQIELHHTCNYGRRAQAGSKLYDAIVLFNDSCSLTSSFAYNTLMQKVEGEWFYRMCLPQRDFLPGQEATQVMDMVDHSLVCIFLMDDGFFDCRWCDCALQNALKYPGKTICVLFLSEAVVRLWKTRLDRIAKVGTVINWKANETASKSALKRIFTQCDNWDFLKKSLPPNQHLSCC